MRQAGQSTQTRYSRSNAPPSSLVLVPGARHSVLGHDSCVSRAWVSKIRPASALAHPEGPHANLSCGTHLVVSSTLTLQSPSPCYSLLNSAAANPASASRTLFIICLVIGWCLVGYLVGSSTFMGLLCPRPLSLSAGSSATHNQPAQLTQQATGQASS
ncbi:hypothetical protein EV126DRAFT_411806 [Verticillium dahliae]|nr:hypothetical protein EV126DRAFT_411806 [Verticillium dahliae]